MREGEGERRGRERKRGRQEGDIGKDGRRNVRPNIFSMSKQRKDEGIFRKYHKLKI